MINHNYDKFILIMFPQLSGGCFLSCCLSLSDDVVFQIPKLSEMQLNNNFSIEKKWKYLQLVTTRDIFITTNWTDFGICEKNFYGIHDSDYYDMIEEDILNFNYPKIVSECISNNKFIIATEHYDLYAQKILNCWKNCKLIKFVNHKSFIKNRIQNKNIPIFCTQSRIKYNEKVKSLNLKSIEGLYDNAYKWDCDWFFSKDKTIYEIEKLYDFLTISGFDAKILSNFYDLWINIILK
jgi:hypothetical protein